MLEWIGGEYKSGIYYGAMATSAVAASVLGIILAVVSLGFIVYILWDRRRIAIEYRDQETGAVDVVKARPKDEGVEFDVKGYPTHMIRPQKQHMGTWHGSVMPWSYPLVTIDPHSGEQFASRRAGPDAEEFPSELTDEDGELKVEPEILSIPWAHVYWKWIDSDAVQEALEANKSIWAKMQGALIVGMVVMALAFLGSVWITSGGG